LQKPQNLHPILDKAGILVSKEALDRKDVADGIRHLVPPEQSQAIPPPPTTSGMTIPDHAIERLARCMLPMIQKYYDSEEGQQKLAIWKQSKQKGS